MKKIAATLTAMTLGLAGIGIAQADDLSAPGHDPYYPTLQTQSTATHAQVQQALRQAELKGLMSSNGHIPYYPSADTSGK